MNALRTLTDRPAALWSVTVVAAIALGLITSNILGVGLFLILPGAVQWLMRR